MNWLSRERKNTSCHIMSQKDQKFNRILNLDIPKFHFQNKLEKKTSHVWAFVRQTGPWKPKPPKNLQEFLQILNPMNDAEILAPEFIDDANEMVV